MIPKQPAVFVLLSSALLLAATPAMARQGEGASHASAPVARAVPLQAPVTVDGRLDEADWRGGTPVTSFTQLDPNEGEPVSERTEVYVAYDAEALYVGARLYDTGPVSRRLVRRDAIVNDSDWLAVALDSYHDHLTSFRFWVNPDGVRRDELLTSGGSRSATAGGGGGGGGAGGGGGTASSFLERGGQADASWEPVWSAASAVSDSGWTAEMRI